MAENSDAVAQRSDALTQEKALLFARHLELPGGDLAVEAGSVSSPAEEDAPAMLAADAEARALVRETQRLAAQPRESGSSANTEAQVPRAEPHQAGPKTTLRQPREVIKRMAAEEVDLGDDNADTVALMHRLHDANEQTAHDAEERLKKRGFGPAQLELAREMTDSDPAVRRQLAELLPRVPGIDASVWLIWLSRDADPQVRLAAMNVMVTTGDPKVVSHVARMSREDNDPRIREQGSRLYDELTGRSKNRGGSKY